MEDKIKLNLLDEFRGEENSFLLSIRCDLTWKHEKFISLLKLMNDYCNNIKINSNLDREISQGFWFVSHFIKDWTSHPNFREKNRFSIEYYEEAYEIIYNISYQYFMDESIYQSLSCFDEEINRLEKFK